MAHFHDSALIGASGQGGYQIERSLRFNAPDSAFLSRAFTSDGGSTWTISCWLKRSEVDTRNFSFTLMHAGAYPSPYEHIQIGNNQIIYYNDGGASAQGGRTTSAVFRDCSAWYHIVCVRQGTSQFKIYVNGVEQAAASNTNPSASYALNKAATMYIGQNNNYDGGGTKYSAGYLTEYHFVSGQALTPSSFGETDTITGVWKPKRYSGTYGTNGFYLKFADNSGTTSTTLGKDSSGNGNNWTPNNFSVTAGADNDSLIDTPTNYADGSTGRGNYCTINPIVYYNSQATITNGCLTYTASNANWIRTIGTFAVSSGKWYWEYTPANANEQMGGIQTTANSTYNAGLNNWIGSDAGGYGYYSGNGNKFNNSSSTAYGASYTTNDTIGVALDLDAGTLVFYKNGVSQGTAFSGLTDTFVPAFSLTTNAGANVCNVNFGQRAFAYTPPAGFLALNTQNLLEPSIKKPNQWMDATTYTGNGSALAVSNSGSMQPSLLWIKGRSGATDHQLVDAVRGAKAVLVSNTTAAETVYGADQVSFDSGGFTVGGLSTMNTNSSTYVCWQWKESATPGFDIVTYTGDGVAGRTVSHSLGVAPSMMFVKRRTTAGASWLVYHASAGSPPQNNFLVLNATDAVAASSLPWNNTAPTSTVFTVGTSGGTNNNGDTFVAYLWSEVAGFSKFGSYSGSGSADGPFVFLGFLPRLLLVKRTDTTDNWRIYDTARNPYNAGSYPLYPNLSNAEDASTDHFDWLSNGFKCRSTNINVSGGTYIYAAWSGNPFKYSLAR